MKKIIVFLLLPVVMFSLAGCTSIQKGIGYGALSGAVIAGAIGIPEASKRDDSAIVLAGVAGGAVFGAIVGGIVGYCAEKDRVI